MVDHIHNVKKAHALRAVLKNFYDGFKGLDEHMRALVITGVSKFAKTSIFSGLNNLNELSNESEAADLIGYTEQEVRTNFADYVSLLAREANMTSEEMLGKYANGIMGINFLRRPLRSIIRFQSSIFLRGKNFRTFGLKRALHHF